MTETKDQTTDPARAFAKGMTFGEYAADLRVHRQSFLEHYDQLGKIVGGQPSPWPSFVRTLIITEDWCPDSVFNVPIMARLAQASTGDSLRVMRRTDCRLLADAFPGRGAVSRVPTFIFMNDANLVMGHWSERCASSQRWFEAFTKETPMPAFDLVDGIPAPPLLTWMNLRISREKGRFYQGVWREVIEEVLAVLGSKPGP